MHVFFKDLFDKERCELLSKVLMDAYDKGSVNYEGVNNAHYGNSYGIGCLPEYEVILRELTPIIMEKTGYTNIAVENSYSRIYRNGGRLEKHIDREGLDLTLTVCTYNDINKPWPLYVRCIDGVVREFETGVGDGALILGTKMEHWRDPLVCDDNQKVLQSFFHWRIQHAKKIF
jgi:hypothetical protein